jgi:hypothetical protein
MVTSPHAVRHELFQIYQQLNPDQVCASPVFTPLSMPNGFNVQTSSSTAMTDFLDCLISKPEKREEICHGLVLLFEWLRTAQLIESHTEATHLPLLIDILDCRVYKTTTTRFQDVTKGDLLVIVKKMYLHIQSLPFIPREPVDRKDPLLK